MFDVLKKTTIFYVKMKNKNHNINPRRKRCDFINRKNIFFIDGFNVLIIR